MVHNFSQIIATHTHNINKVMILVITSSKNSTQFHWGHSFLHIFWTGYVVRSLINMIPRYWFSNQTFLIHTVTNTRGIWAYCVRSPLYEWGFPWYYTYGPKSRKPYVKFYACELRCLSIRGNSRLSVDFRFQPCMEIIVFLWKQRLTNRTAEALGNFNHV